jgi:hypothetical protein
MFSHLARFVFTPEHYTFVLWSHPVAKFLFCHALCSNDYQMIMTVLYKRLNDTGRNWRHVYKVNWNLTSCHWRWHCVDRNLECFDIKDTNVLSSPKV